MMVGEDVEGSRDRWCLRTPHAPHRGLALGSALPIPNVWGCWATASYPLAGPPQAEATSLRQ